MCFSVIKWLSGPTNFLASIIIVLSLSKLIFHSTPSDSVTSDKNIDGDHSLFLVCTSPRVVNTKITVKLHGSDLCSLGPKCPMCRAVTFMVTADACSWI